MPFNKTSEGNQIWESVGYFVTDKGMMWMGCPHPFIEGSENPKDIGEDWDQFLGKVKERVDPTGCTAQFVRDDGENGLGVVVSTGFGEGMYPIQIRRSPEGEIAELRVLFIREVTEKSVTKIN